MNLELKQAMYFLIVLILMTTGLSLIFIDNGVLWSLAGLILFSLSMGIYNKRFKKI